MTILFASAIFTLEKTQIYYLTFVFALIFILLVILGVHRHFWIGNHEERLHIVSVWKSSRAEIPIKSIRLLRVSKHGVEIFSDEWEHGRVYYMRKLYLGPFVDVLTNNENFTGTVEYIDRLSSEDVEN